MRFAALFLSLLLASATLTFAPRVFAQQASDADRAAARELFNKGVELQNQQKFADALDQFERSQKVVNAPTILLHVGQCQAALGRLVEAAEAFRSAVRFQLPPSPPAPFVAAQNEATTQLAGIEPRIPELKITVQPKDIPTLTVTVDDQPVNTALVGVSRPINPGTHKIAASAPGYTKAERTLDLKEKQKLEVSMTLVSTGGVVYGPSTGDANTAVTVQNAPAGSASAATSSTPPPPPPPTDTRSKMGIFLGPRLGLSVMGGSLPTSTTDTTSIGDVAGAGGAFGLEAFFRFVRVLYFGVTGEVAGYGGKDVQVVDPQTGNSLIGTSSMGTAMISGRFGVLTNPDGFGFFGDVGAGYRYLDLKRTSTDGTTTLDVNYAGIDYILRLGMHFKAGKYVRIVPQTEFTFGSLGIGGGSVSGTNISTRSLIDTSGNTAGHVTFFFGIGGYFDIDLDKPKAAAASTPSTPAPEPAAPATPSSTPAAPASPAPSPTPAK